MWEFWILYPDNVYLHAIKTTRMQPEALIIFLNWHIALENRSLFIFKCYEKQIWTKRYNEEMTFSPIFTRMVHYNWTAMIKLLIYKDEFFVLNLFLLLGVNRSHGAESELSKPRFIILGHAPSNYMEDTKQTFSWTENWEWCVGFNFLHRQWMVSDICKKLPRSR